MWWKTHAAAGAAASLFYVSNIAGKAPIFPQTSLNMWAFVGISVATAVAVDIDSKNSIIGRYLYPVSATTQAVLGHRGPLHSPFVPLMLYLVLSLMFPLFGLAIGPAIALPVLIGYLFGHLIPDIFNPAGLSLWPLKGRISIPLFTPLGIFDKCLCVMLDLCVCFIVFNFIKTTINIPHLL